MSRINASAILICIFFITFSLVSFQNTQQLNLASGLYIVSNNNASKFQLNQTGKFFDVKYLVININHITSSQVGHTPMINGKIYPFITLNLDPAGIRAIDSLASLNTDQKLTLGLILKGKLRAASEFQKFHFDNFKGPGLKIQGGSKNSFDEFNVLKKEFDDTKQ